MTEKKETYNQVLIASDDFVRLNLLLDADIETAKQKLCQLKKKRQQKRTQLLITTA